MAQYSILENGGRRRKTPDFLGTQLDSRYRRGIQRRPQSEKQRPNRTGLIVERTLLIFLIGGFIFSHIFTFLISVI